MKLIVFVHTCAKYEASRALLIQDAMGAQTDVVFITDNQASALTHYINLGPYERGWQTYHPSTVVKMFDTWLALYPDYDYFIMIDDDALVNVPRLKQYLAAFDPSKALMIGDFNNWPPIFFKKPQPEYSHWVGGGAGIVFTKLAVELFLQIKNRAAFDNHDVWLHQLWMKSDRTIQRIHCADFHHFAPTDGREVISVHFNRDMSLLTHFKANLAR